MTGRLPGPTSHEAQAHPPGPGRHRGGSTARPRGRPAGHSGPGARPGNAQHRFSVPQGRPPLLERWRRGSRCSEAVGLKQRKKPLPFPAMTSPPRKHRPPLCLPCHRRGNVPPRHNVLPTWGPAGAAGGAAVPAGPASPRRPLAICSTPLINGFAKKDYYLLPPPVVVCFFFSSTPRLLRQGAWVRDCSAPSRGRWRRKRSGAGYAKLFISRGCT